MKPPKKALVRCTWATNDLSIQYHDREWGVPQHDDRALFEFLILEGAQAGLSWDTILRKRANYRAAFDGFDPKKIARYDRRKTRQLLRDEGIVRNRLKIASAIQNAKAFLAVQNEFGSFDRYIWQFVGGKPLSKRLAAREEGSSAHSRIGRDEPRPEETRLQLRRLDHLLCLHAGHRNGQRPRDRVFPLSPPLRRMC